MTPDAIIVAAATVVIWLSCAAGVFSDSYGDTLLQRLALAGLAIGAAALFVDVLRSGEASGPVTVFALAAALFGAETARKVAWRRHCGRWRDDR